MNSSKLTFVHITDTHIYEDDQKVFEFSPDPPNKRARLLVEQIKQLPFDIDFILHTGDVVWDPTVACYEKATEILSALDQPIHYTIGNHDEAKMLQRVLLKKPDAEVTETYHYDVMVKGTRLIGLDGIHEDIIPKATLPDDQLQWLDETCAQDESPLVIAIHHHPFPNDVGCVFLDQHMQLTNAKALHNILKKHASRVRGVFFGHIHQSTTLMLDGIFYSGSASPSFHISSDETIEGIVVDPQGVPEFSVVRIDGPQTYLRRYPFQG